MLEKESCKNLIYIFDVPEHNTFTNYTLRNDGNMTNGEIKEANMNEFLP